MWTPIVAAAPAASDASCSTEATMRSAAQRCSDDPQDPPRVLRRGAKHGASASIERERPSSEGRPAHLAAQRNTAMRYAGEGGTADPSADIFRGEVAAEMPNPHPKPNPNPTAAPNPTPTPAPKPNPTPAPKPNPKQVAAEMSRLEKVLADL